MFLLFIIIENVIQMIISSVLVYLLGKSSDIDGKVHLIYAIQ